MALRQLEHFLIQTTDLAATRDWYVDVLGMEVGPAPEFHFPVCWLYLGGTAVLHLAEGGDDVPDNRKAYLGQQSTASHGSGVIDHVAFNATRAKDMLAHFDARGIDYSTRRISDTGMLQVFLLDPNGVKVELNFVAAEAEGVQEQLRTGDLAGDD